jgi:glycosyltransferase involved in cell wall biosynthesis
MKLSIIIPTRNRPDTLYYTLKTAIEQDYQKLEVIVCDNSTDEKTRDLINQFDDERIVYVRSEKLLSMADNWELAFNNASGDYLIFIGDDDGVCGNAVSELAREILSSRLMAYKWSTAEYQWPIDSFEAKVISFAPKVKNTTYLNHPDMARRVMQDGGWRYYQLPSVYHAAISRECLKKIQESTGRLFHTTQPDLFTAMAIPEFSSNYAHMSTSVTIQGRSAKSNGGAGVAKNGREILEQSRREYGDYKTDPILDCMPLYMRLFMEPFVMSSKLFNVYHDNVLNFNAMLAFAIRIGFIKKKYILDNNLKFPINFKFSRIEFEKYNMIHKLATYRRIFLNVLTKRKYKSKEVPGNIYDFAKTL